MYFYGGINSGGEMATRFRDILLQIVSLRAILRILLVDFAEGVFLWGKRNGSPA